ncbi:MAG: hydroxypyruvate isomerase family protein [Planctomycetota bacterium]|jgi:hydroxypyruvate isomerase
MLNLSVCIEMLFKEVDFDQRPAEVARAGFAGIEFWGRQDKDLAALRAACKQAGVVVASFGALGGHALVEAQSADELRDTIRADAEAAHLLGAETLFVTVGDEVDGTSRAEHIDNIVANLSAVVPLVEDEGLRLAVEPLNTLVDHVGYFLDSSTEARRIVEEVASPAVGMLYDVYHMQIMEGNLIETIRANLDIIYHVHVGDVPGRQEPGTGEINYANVLGALEEAGYEGWCGMEFRPSESSAAALERTRQVCGLT